MAKGKTKGNNYIKEALIILAILVGLVLFFGTVYHISHRDTDDTPSVHSAAISGVTVRDDETGISYVRCPIGIGANTLKDEFLTVGNENSGIVMYTIMFEDSSKFISEAKDALGGAYVYRAEGEKEITLESFAPVSAGIFMEGINSPIDNFYGKDALDKNNTLEDGRKYISLIKSALTDGAAATLTGELSETAYYIRLYSEVYPGLYYEVLFCTDVNGVAYLQDLVTEKTVLSPDELTARIIG